jgi:hypothetical protein
MAFQPIRNQALAALQTTINTESPIEKTMMAAFLKNKKFTIIGGEDKPEGEGFFVFPQKELGSYRADFIIKAVGYMGANRIWPPNKKVYINVECDGAEFHTTAEQKAHDKRRDDYFRSKGMRTFRFTGSEIYKNSDLIVSDLAAHLANEVFNA